MGSDEINIEDTRYIEGTTHSTRILNKIQNYGFESTAKKQTQPSG